MATLISSKEKRFFRLITQNNMKRLKNKIFGFSIKWNIMKCFLIKNIFWVKKKTFRLWRVLRIFFPSFFQGFFIKVLLIKIRTKDSFIIQETASQLNHYEKICFLEDRLEEVRRKEQRETCVHFYSFLLITYFIISNKFFNESVRWWSFSLQCRLPESSHYGKSSGWFKLLGFHVLKGVEGEEGS